MTTQYGGHQVCRPRVNHCILSRSSADHGRTWHQAIVMPRRQCPPAKLCRKAAWQNDPGIAVDSSGVIYAAWMNQWDVTFANSRDHGRTWTGLHDFRRVAWEDDGNGATAWKVWYRATANRGATWGRAARLSNRGSGAPYKSRAGFRFPYGDYFGITVDRHGTSYLVWSEGTSYDGPGGTWWARNH